MKIIFIAIALSFMVIPSIAMAEPKFVSNINGSSFAIKASNIGSQAYECVYSYSFNHAQGSVPNQFSGKFYIEAGVSNISVISKDTDRMISTLDFDYKCTEK
ncbi:hypothetical protein NDN11_07980 [Acinetobacter sp. C26M]|uniref:hypothetical protein n=1 Tax=unclassified Acinetobacter TaxID=196816 RepID=UPI00141E1FC8|nr:MULTISPECIES: hypothetical protein [unclassified Acinetobacter]NIE95001.1 hypothetical protein [Acinetobacter sp. Tr-809]USA48038.1 hypothetical protein NDN11_07980 [Acinetobacter sp. C26M]USA51518.1 hypothetical protein NDN12_07980 [Acinetobacter sp. C26G]